MSEKILLSIIVPIYNVEAYLPQCVDSILKQKFADFEVLLVNDGSTDASLKICEDYRKKDRRVKVINKPNGGLISAKKAGLQQAVGEYVGFVDGDDWIDDDMYEKLCKSAVATQADIVISDNIVDFSTHSLAIRQGIPCGVYDKTKLIQLVYPNMAFAKELYKLGVSPSLCTKIFKRTLVTPFQFAVNEMIKGGEDAACTYPCMLQAQKIVYLEDCCAYHYRVHDKSMTHKKRELNIQERMTLLTHLGEAFGKYDYEGLDTQYGFYSAAVLEELLLNFFEYGKERDAQRVKELLEHVRKNIAWEYVMTLYKSRLYPRPTNQIVAYLNNPSWLNACKIRARVRFISFKQFVKGVILKVNGKKD